MRRMRTRATRSAALAVGALAACGFAAGCRSTGRAPRPAPTTVVAPASERHPSVVAVMASGGGSGGTSTGFYVAPDRVVTCGHGVVGRERWGIRGRDGKRVASGGVLASSSALDLAVIDVPREGAPPPFALADAPPRVGDPVRVVWHRGSRTQRTDAGVVTSREFAMDSWASLFSIRAPLDLGCSGAPVLDANDRVVGVVVAGDPERGVFSAVPVRHVPPLLARAAAKSAGAAAPRGPVLRPESR
jgi:S1-C subfamily serine protease